MCQGASVQAARLGRCWVVSLSVSLARVMASMAWMASRRDAECAMVDRDGTAIVAVSSVSTDATVEGPSGPTVGMMPLVTLCPVALTCVDVEMSLAVEGIAMGSVS